MSEQGGGRGGGRGKKQVRRMDLSEFNRLPNSATQHPPSTTPDSTNPNPRRSRGIPNPRPWVHRGSFHKHMNSMPGPQSRGFPGTRGMPPACPSECSTEDGSSASATSHFVGPHWDEMRAALEERRKELIAANEMVTAARLVEWLMKKTGKDKSELGLDPPKRFPYLRELVWFEQAVEVCIVCYLGYRPLAATIWDLEQYICMEINHFQQQALAKGRIQRSLQVTCYDDLRLGPLVSHWRVQCDFQPKLSGFTVPQVSLSNVAAALQGALDRGGRLEPADVEKELCKTFHVDNQHHLGVLVMIHNDEDLRKFIKRLGDVKQFELNAIHLWAQEPAQKEWAQYYAMLAASGGTPATWMSYDAEQAGDYQGMEAEQFEEQEGKGADASTSTAQPAWQGMDGDEHAKSAPTHPYISMEDLVFTVRDLGSGRGTSFAALADLEHRVLAHYEAKFGREGLSFGGLCKGVPSLLQLLKQQPELAKALASPEDEAPAAQGRPAVTKAQLARATTQAVDAYHAIHQSSTVGESRVESTDKESWVERAICMQYNVSSVKQLGHGNVCELLSMCQEWRNGAFQSVSRHVRATAALLCGQSVAKGTLDGHSTDDMRSMARAALCSTPMLADLAQWTQWPTVFQDHPAVRSLDSPLLDDAMACDRFTVLELPGGQLIKVPDNTHLMADFEESLVRLDPVATVAALLGYVAQGKVCTKTVLEPLILCIQEQMRKEKEQLSGSTNEACEKLTRFVLQCMSFIPSILRPMLAQHVFLTPLKAEVMDGDAHATAKYLLQCASTTDKDAYSGTGDKYTSMVDQRSHLLPMLHALGMHLNLRDLQDHFVETVWKAGQAAPQDAPVESAEAAATSVSHGGFVEPSSTILPLKETSETSAGVAEEADNAKLMTQRWRAHLENKQTGSGPAEGAAQQEHPEGGADQQPAQPAVAADTKEEQDARALILRIREGYRRRADTSEDLSNESLGNSLELLSEDIYKVAHHFQMELVQNADDNQYGPLTPRLAFEVYDDKILVKNNELGFTETEVQAICKVGGSTKKHKEGFTGEKGIGFKSVFKVTEKPAIHSNHFHFAFDLRTDGKLGYIVPSPVRPLPLGLHNPKEDQFTTCVELPLKEEFLGTTDDSLELRRNFNFLQPLLLLFLRKLHQIKIMDMVGRSSRTIRRTQDSIISNCLRLHSTQTYYAEGAEKARKVESSMWLRVDRILQPRFKRGKDKIEKTCVSVAYPLPEEGAEHKLPERQPVFAYLPVRSYNLKFVVNANWQVESSREEVHLTPFNKELASAIPGLAMQALAQFRGLPTPRNRPYFWIDWWLKTLPLEGDVSEEPFASNARQLCKMVAETQFLPTKSGLGFVKPEQAYVCVDEGMLTLLAEERTQQLLNVHFVHPDIQSLHNSPNAPSLREQLRVKEFGSRDLLPLARKVCSYGLLQELGLHWIVQLLYCVFANVHEWTKEEGKGILAEVKKLPILPLLDGSNVSMEQLEQESATAAAAAPSGAPALARQLVFFPLESAQEEAATQAAAQGEQEAGLWAGTGGLNKASSRSAHAQSLVHECGLNWRQMMLRQLHPLLFQVDPSKAYKLRKGLSELGVQEITAADVVQHHVLPMFRNHKQQLMARQAQEVHQTATQEDTRQQLMAALTYVALSGLWRDQSISQQLHACAVIITTQGPHHIPSAPSSIYLPPSLGNEIIDLPVKVPSHPWVLVDREYATSSVAARRIRPSDWANVFTALGTHKWLPLVSSVRELSLADWQQHLAAAAAAGMSVCEASSTPGGAGAALADAGANGVGPANHQGCSQPPARAAATADGFGVSSACVQLHDVACPEFLHLLTSIKGSATYISEFMYLGKLMEAQWQSGSCYASSMTTHAALSPAATAAAAAAAAENCNLSYASQPVIVVVPTSFALCLRTSAWLLSRNNVPTKPTELFLRSRNMEWLDGLVPYVNQKHPESIRDRSVLESLGVHTMLSLEKALTLLIHWATRDTVYGSGAHASATQQVVGSRMVTSVRQMAELYKYIWREVQQDINNQALVVDSFTKYPLLWLPDKKADLKQKERVIKLPGNFYSISCARYKDAACALEAVPWERQKLRIINRFYLSKFKQQHLFVEPLYRPTISSAGAPAQGTDGGANEGADEGAEDEGGSEKSEADGDGRDGDGEADGDGEVGPESEDGPENEDGQDGASLEEDQQPLVPKGPSLQEHVEAMQAFADCCADGEMSYEDARSWVMKIFEMFITSLNRKGWPLRLVQELRALLAPESPTKAPRVFPSMQGTFVSTQDNLLVNDDCKLFMHFANIPGVHFLDMREDNVLKLHDMGVRKLSTAVQPRVYPAEYSGPQLQNTIYRALLLAQRFLRSRSETKRLYEELKQAGIMDLFRGIPGRQSFKVVAAKKLKVQYILQRGANIEPAATPLFDCGAALENSKDLYVEDRGGRFNTKQVASELSHLLHPHNVAAVLNNPRGSAAELPHLATMITSFLEGVLYRLMRGSEDEVEQYLHNEDCGPLPENETPWVELPKEQEPEAPSQTNTPPSAHTDEHSHGTDANADLLNSTVIQQQQVQQQQKQAGGVTTANMSAEEAERVQREHAHQRELRATAQRERAHQHAAWADEGEEDTTKWQPTLLHAHSHQHRGGAAAQSQQHAVWAEDGEKGADFVPGQHRPSHAHIHQHTAQAPAHSQQHAAWAEDDGVGATDRLSRSSHAHEPKHASRKGVGAQPPHRDHANRGVHSNGDGVHLDGPHAPVVGAPRPEKGSQLCVNGGPPSRGAVSPTAKANMQVPFMWSSATGAEAAARSAGLLQDFDTSQLLDVLQATSQTGGRLMDAFPPADPMRVDSPEDVEAVGRVGEEIAFAWLRRTQDAQTDVNWLNEHGDSGRPYDILIKDASSNETFVEVKASRATKAWFYISRKEMEFAGKAGDAYHIYHLTGAGTAEPKLRQYINPVKQWTNKSILTMMASPTEIMSSGEGVREGFHGDTQLK